MAKRGRSKKLKIFSLPLKQGQMHLSFGMIFSIILIIAFVAFAFYAIMKIIGLQKSVTVGQFVKDLQEDVDKMWRGSEGSQPVEYRLPSEITYVCFVDYSIPKEGTWQDLYSPLRRSYTGNENLFFYPSEAAGNLASTEIAHLDMNSIISINNPFCIKNTKGKIKITLSKNYGEALVMLEE